MWSIVVTTRVTVIVCSFVLIGQCFGTSVRLSYFQPELRGISMAESINVSLTTGSNGTWNFTLKKVTHMSSDIPLHVLILRPDGQYESRREIVGDNENTAFYQDLTNDAVMEIKRTHLIGNSLSTLQFKGQFRYNGSLFTISRGTRPKRDVTSPEEDTYVLQERPEVLQVYDYHLPSEDTPPQDRSGNLTPEAPTPLPSDFPQQRQRREATPTYYVDIVAVVDYRAYSGFLGSSSGDRTAALRNLMEYYTFVVTGMDLLYQGITTTNYRIRVRLVKVMVAETSKDSAFTEEFRISGTLNEIDSTLSLEAFKKFVSNSSRDVIGPYDHAMLFTRFNITSTTNGVPNSNNAGLAYLGTFCSTDGLSSSIIEDLQGFSSVAIAAHELGHSMSSVHDGENNICSLSDHFIMAAILPSPQDAVNQNPWKFSSCSVKYFTDYISTQLKTTTGASCLMETIQADADIPDVSGSLPGLKYPADEQCKMLENNNGSFICPSLNNYTLNEDPSVICRKMYCKVADFDGCRSYLAADGTLCGDGKLCLYGECVSHELAPQGDETCLYGDDRLFSYRNLPCADAVKAEPWICYNNAKRCCISCKTYYRLVQGCEYGDRLDGCETSYCSFSSTLKLCCATCDYGTPITTMETTTLPRSTTSSTATTKTTAPLATTTAKTLTTSSSRATLTIFETTSATELTSSVNKTENARSNTDGPSSFLDKKCLLSFLMSLFFISL